MVVGMGRQPPAVPAGTAVPVVPGLDDNDEDDEDEKAPRSLPGSAGPFSWGRISVFANRDSS